MSNVLDVSQQEQRLAERISPDITKALTVSRSAGGVMFADAEQIMEFAKVMAVTGVGIKQHLRGKVGPCLAITVQAVEWEMSPFAVANKSYFVNDQIAFESQLIQAVILKRAPIIGRIKFEFEGEGADRICIASARLNDGSGDVVEYRSPEFSKIQPKNSPLWKNDPDQQHCYYSGRALCRRHFPDVLLGVYADDELYANGRPAIDEPAFAKDVTPALPRGRMTERLDALSQQPSSVGAPAGEADEEDTTEHDDGGVVTSDEQDDNDLEHQEVAMTPREQLIHALRGELMKGASALRLINDLTSEQADLLTQQDRDELKTAWRQMQGSKPRRSEAVQHG